MQVWRTVPGMFVTFSNPGSGDDRTYQEWRSRVESFKTTAGARPVLEHVAECVWADHYAANDDACDAVVAELTKID